MNCLEIQQRAYRDHANVAFGAGVFEVMLRLKSYLPKTEGNGQQARRCWDDFLSVLSATYPAVVRSSGKRKTVLFIGSLEEACRYRAKHFPPDLHQDVSIADPRSSVMRLLSGQQYKDAMLSSTDGH